MRFWWQDESAIWDRLLGTSLHYGDVIFDSPNGKSTMVLGMNKK